MSNYGEAPKLLGPLDVHLTEQMHYLYLPVIMNGEYNDVRLPSNLVSVFPLVEEVKNHAQGYEFCYLSAVRGVASPGNSLNRPGWHCDGFGTQDLNAIYWKGAGTRFAIQRFKDIDPDDQTSLKQFDSQVKEENVYTFPERNVYLINPYVVHSVPLIEKTEERQFIKLSFSNDQYNLDGNSHNYLFWYKWKMLERSAARNITNKDFVKLT